MPRNLTKASCVLILAFVLCPGLQAADVLYIGRAGDPSAALAKAELACSFYGFGLQTLNAPRASGGGPAGAFGEGKAYIAVIAEAAALEVTGTKALFDRLAASPGGRPPLLIVEVAASTDPRLLEEFSSGTIAGCRTAALPSRSGEFLIAGDAGLVRQLAGQSYKADLLDAGFLIIGPAEGANAVCSWRSAESGSALPVFARSRTGAGETFFLTDHRLSGSPYLLRPGVDRGALLELLPYLIFLRSAGGDRGWHSPGYFANLIIDDPWLREPFGHLKFGPLRDEMRKVPFHLTLAFVPWNFDRSDPAVVALFLAHPELFSISPHGNNHDHQEFSGRIPAEEQEKDIVQGSARMEEFTRLTKIPFDRVMVFPHGIGSRESLRLLGKYHFLATVNGDHIPAGEARPRDLQFYLRSYSLDWSNIASLKRSGAADADPGNIALDLFLGNPIILYSHHDLFRKGIDAFSRQAEKVNSIEPGVRWSNLGTIARRLYLERERDDGALDVLALCHEIDLSNDRAFPIAVHFLKKEPPGSPVAALLVDGSPVGFERDGAELRADLLIPAMTTRAIRIAYADGEDPRPVDIAKSSRRVRFLRWISDFRDVTLSRNLAGRAIIGIYYDSGLYRWGGRRLALAAGIVLLAAMIGLWRLRRLRIKRKARRRSGYSGRA